MAKKIKQDINPRKATGGKKPVAVLTGTVAAPTRVEIRITDANYAKDVLALDVEHKRVWFERPADKDGWMKLYYSADGPTGDPFPIGKIRFLLELTDLDEHFGNISGLDVEVLK